MFATKLSVPESPLSWALLLSTLFLSCLSSMPVEAQTSGRLEDNVLPAQGRQETIFTVHTFERYSLKAKSEQGTAVQMVDRKNGPGVVHGEAGVSNGRFDLFLDKGEYKFIAISDENGSGQAQITAQPFIEKNEEPLLIETEQLVASSLADTEQRSYWLNITERQTVFIEAAGRSLADLRLWRQGDWLMESEPVYLSFLPEKGKPLNGLQLIADLSPGLYRLTAYGGPAQDWAQSSSEQPLFIRYNIPRLPSTDRRTYQTNPFGVDRWLIPKKANFFRLELPKPGEAALEIRHFTPENPLGRHLNSAAITKKTLPPVTEITTSGADDGYSLISITTKADTSYTLQHFTSLGDQSVSFSGKGRHWVGTIPAGSPKDWGGSTGILTQALRGKREKMLDSRVVLLNSTRGLRQTVNLIDHHYLFLDITESGSYEISIEGGEADFRVEPFLLSVPENYEPPSFRAASSYELNQGLYVLAVRPRKNSKGVATITLTPAETPADSLTWVQADPGLQFGPLELDQRKQYSLYLNYQGGAKSGFVLRPWPVDLSDPLPFNLAAGRSLAVSVTMPNPGTVRAVTEDGSLLPLSLDNGPWQQQVEIDGFDPHTVQVRNDGEQPRFVSLSASESYTYVPVSDPKPAANLVTKPAPLPVIRQGEPLFLDMAEQERRSFLVRVAEPGLYRLQSSGLLRTEGNLRTRTITSLDRQVANGVGRNFLIQQYMGQGEYLVSVSPKGKSAGHLGVELHQTTLHAKGEVRTGQPSRFSVAEGEGLVYHLIVNRAGEYRITAFGLKRRFRIRLEDDNGWPLVPPGVSGSQTMELPKGQYTIIILPEVVECRGILLVEAVAEEKNRTGHGPHDLKADDFGRRIEYRWLEPDPGQERLPDQWCFAVPAPVTANFFLSPGMVGELHEKTAGRIENLEIFGHRPWKGEIAAGDYCLEVKSVRPNNRFPYSISVQFKELVSGHHQEVTVPAEMAISVGKKGEVSLGSVGSSDVRAKLLTEQGDLIAMGDDRANDWNFLIRQPLDPGHYLLKIDPVGTESATITVAMDQPRIGPGPDDPASKVDTQNETSPAPPSTEGSLVWAKDLFSSLPLMTSSPLPFGYQTVPLLPGRAASFELPAGIKDISLVVPGMAVAVFSRESQLTSVLVGEEKRTVDSLTTEADNLTLLNQGASEQLVGLTVLPATHEHGATLNSRQLIRRSFSSPGRYHLPLFLTEEEKAQGVRIKRTGALGSATYSQENGATLSAPFEEPIHTNGTLTIEHAIGFIAIWVEKNNTPGWPLDEHRVTMTVSGADNLIIQGDSQTVHFQQPEAGALWLRSTEPLLSRFQPKNQPPEIQVWENSLDHSYFLPKGESSLTLASAKPRSLTGNLSMVHSPCRPLSEGTGPTSTLIPGQGACFTIELPDKGVVGIGVRSQPDLALAELRNDKGLVLGQGVVQMHHLEPGSYSLFVSNPQGGEPLTITPIIHGLAAKGNNPPQDVIQSYLQEAAGQGE